MWLYLELGMCNLAYFHFTTPPLDLDYPFHPFSMPPLCLLFEVMRALEKTFIRTRAQGKDLPREQLAVILRVGLGWGGSFDLEVLECFEGWFRFL